MLSAAAGLLPWYMPETARASRCSARPRSPDTKRPPPFSLRRRKAALPATPVAGQAVWNQVETVEARQILGAAPSRLHPETWTLAQYEGFLGFLPSRPSCRGADLRARPTAEKWLSVTTRSAIFTTPGDLPMRGALRPPPARCTSVNSDFIPYWNAPRAPELTDAVTQEDISALLRQGSLRS